MPNGKILLYVEDDPGSRKVMRVLVSTLADPVQLITFEDSTDFIERVAALETMPDVFLLDIQITPHDGFSMLKMLRSSDDFADKMVMALTASVMNEEINKLREAGFDGVIGKPLSFHTFPDTLRRILAGERIWSVPR